MGFFLLLTLFWVLSPFCGTSSLVHRDTIIFFCHSGSLWHNNFPLLRWFTATNNFPLSQWLTVTLEFSFVKVIQRNKGFFLCCTGSLWLMNFPSPQWFTATKELSFVIVVHCDNFPLFEEKKKKNKSKKMGLCHKREIKTQKSMCNLKKMLALENFVSCTFSTP